MGKNIYLHISQSSFRNQVFDDRESLHFPSDPLILRAKNHGALSPSLVGKKTSHDLLSARSKIIIKLYNTRKGSQEKISSQGILMGKEFGRGFDQEVLND
jgi:hypothetical protein